MDEEKSTKAPKKAVKRRSDGLVKAKPAKRARKTVEEKDEEKEKDIKIVLPNTWEIPELISDELQIPKHVVQDVIELFEEDNTIPFIARYRKEKTRNMDIKKLYELKESLENLKLVKVKVEKLAQTIAKASKLTPLLAVALSNAKSLDDVDRLAAPFKTGSKKSLAERARQLGLETVSLQILEGQTINLENCVKAETKGLTNVKEVEIGIQHIIADLISKNQDMLQEIRESLERAPVMLESSKTKAATKEEIESTSETVKNTHRVNPKLKFENYYKFSIPIRLIKPHQVLAINRGESLKMLTVKIIIPDRVKELYNQFCERKFVQQKNPSHHKLVQASYNDAWSRLLEPLFSRQIRSQLTKTAEKASVDVFASNLRQLLLTPPVRGKVITGIDPGFKNGCKVAVISPTQDILDTTVFYLNLKGNIDKSNIHANKISYMLKKHGCTTIGIGNGTASRETESFISKMISDGDFHPLDVKYCIVNESGASIYSVTEDAVKEMPDLDPNLRSAVSIARRLQDPLAEYVKIEPKHLGVGMYQHDVTQAQLKTALDDVVVECVSFVGVDVNTGSEALLRKVAGLSATRAKNIVEWRAVNGPFRNREQLKEVKGLGPKSFEQCAGFIRVLSRNLQSTDSNIEVIEDKPIKKQKKGKKGSSKSVEVNYLDMTCIHPESYGVADSFLDVIDETKENLGNPQLILKVKKFINSDSLPNLANALHCTLPALQLIIDGLSQPIDYDMRSELETPLFKKGLNSINDLKPGTKLSGRVTNNVHFGAFVDVGVGQDGLIHSSNMKRATLYVGDRIEVTVKNVDCERRRIGLVFIRKL